MSALDRKWDELITRFVEWNFAPIRKDGSIEDEYSSFCEAANRFLNLADEHKLQRENFEKLYILEWIPSEASLVSSEYIQRRDNTKTMNLMEEMLSQISGRVDKLCGEITTANKKFDEFIRYTENRFDEFVGKTNEDFALAEKRFDYLKTTLDDLPQMSWKKRIAVNWW